jgi:uncharacterized protein (DUF1800 family)
MTARVLRRMGFGTTGSDVDDFLARGDLSSNIARVLAAEFRDDEGVKSTPVPSFDSELPDRDISQTASVRFLKKRQEQNRSLTDWWLRRMVAARQPALEKLTFLWHNHFATNLSPVRSAQLMIQQNVTIRENCLGDFRTLALGMLTDGAMLRWLNGNSNTSKSPNENLAREFMELFALGHGGGYTEKDVREGARALTGWVVSRKEDVRFNPERHDFGDKTVLGKKGNHDAEAFCDIVLSQEASAVFVASRLWQQLASDTPPSADTSAALIAAYGSERNLRKLTHAILSSPEFLEGEATIVNGPVEWAVGLLRAIDFPLKELQSESGDKLRYALRALGQLPFNPPSVGGWPRGRAWLSATAAQLRFETAKLAVAHGDLSSIEDVSENDRIEAAGYLLGIGKWSASSAAALMNYTDSAPALVVAASNTPEYLSS